MYNEFFTLKAKEKKLNKWIAGLLCMMLVITMVAGLGVTEVKADDAVTQHVSTWTE